MPEFDASFKYLSGSAQADPFKILNVFPFVVVQKAVIVLFAVPHEWYDRHC